MIIAKELLTQNFISIDLNDTVAKLLGKFKQTKLHSALVFDDDEYVGVVEKRFLLTKRIDPSTMKLNNLVKKRSKAKTPFFVPELSSQDDLQKICKLLTASAGHVLPVLDKGKVIGVVYASNVAQAVAPEYKKVDCMKLASMKLVTAISNDSLAKALTLITKAGVDHLPVVNEKKELIGMLALSDILEHSEFWSSPRIPRTSGHGSLSKTGYRGERTSLLNLPVKNIMTKTALCCVSPETKVSEALTKMMNIGVCSIILMQNQKPVGILTLKDVLVDYAKK